MLCNDTFMLWAVTFALMFAGFFIYVLSAPVFLMRHLGLQETDFIWLFGPATAGMMLGSYLSARFAQRWSSGRCLVTGFTIMAPVSYTHLDVYKRQACTWLAPAPTPVAVSPPPPDVTWRGCCWRNPAWTSTN